MALLNDPQVKSWRAIMTAFKHVYTKLDSALMQEGFHIARFQIFYCLYFEGSQSAAALSKRLLVTRSNISTFLKRLEQDKLIQICPTSPSMKRPYYRLTTKAERLFEQIFPQHIQRVKKWVPTLPSPLLRALKDIAQA